MNDIITVVALGGEFVGRLLDTNENSVTISSPAMVMNGTLIRDFTESGIAYPDMITISNVVFTIETSQKFADMYKQETGGLVGVQKPGLILS